MRALGDPYETRATEFLIENGYQILARNQNYRVGEIDIIAQESHTLVFVEVRKRDAESEISPEETLSFAKQRRLLKAIQLFLQRYRGKATQVRIDLIGFKGEELRHFKDFMRVWG